MVSEVVEMSWEEVAKEMEGVEGLISMMDEEEEEEEEEEARVEDEGDKEHRNQGKDNCDEDDRTVEVNAGLQSLLLSEILQFRTSQLRRVKDERREEKEEDGTVTDISLFTLDSGKEARSDILVSNQANHQVKSSPTNCWFLGSVFIQF